MNVREQRKFAFLLVLESLIWNSLVLFQHQKQQYTQIFTNLINVYKYFFHNMFGHIKTTFAELVNHQKKTQAKI